MKTRLSVYSDRIQHPACIVGYFDSKLCDEVGQLAHFGPKLLRQPLCLSSRFGNSRKILPLLICDQRHPVSDMKKISRHSRLRTLFSATESSTFGSWF